MGQSRNFVGSLVVVCFAIGIFLLLMDQDMPKGNREILITFVSILFSSMQASLRQITGVDSQKLDELQKENMELKVKEKELSSKIKALEEQVALLMSKLP
jgi:hypothetical protein